MDDEDLADCAVRLAVSYLRVMAGDMPTVQAAALVEDASKRVLADVVAEARTLGYSWGRIAKALGVQRTAAQKRFGKVPTPARIHVLEDQYVRMGDYLKSEEKRSDRSAYETEVLDEVRETRKRCLRRRRGHVIDPLDRFKKVVTRTRKAEQSDDS
ncbi:hypothetical protein [Streptomyces sp. NRRL F-5193]|uniref:hypothetical protein n=1 Tax=Streptomyces sp. NRRL F-5193 TaxID=1463860 RepID=UPI0005B98085|nr:hypothetical protein [Streptomyces sp. NRRL F-5193]